jgi:hypothetical protein
MRRIAEVVVAAGLLTVLAPPVGAAPSIPPYPAAYSLPGSQSAYDLLRAAYPTQAGGNFAVVFKVHKA